MLHNLLIELVAKETTGIGCGMACAIVHGGGLLHLHALVHGIMVARLL